MINLNCPFCSSKNIEKRGKRLYRDITGITFTYFVFKCLNCKISFEINDVYIKEVKNDKET